MFERYIRDLAAFNANAIELLPPTRTMSPPAAVLAANDANDGPVFTHLLREYGLDPFRIASYVLGNFSNFARSIIVLKTVVAT